MMENPPTASMFVCSMFHVSKHDAGESHLPCFTISEMERASSTRTLVPTVDEAKPGPQASLCAPMTKYFSKTQSKMLQFVITAHSIWLKPCSLTPTWFNKAFDDPKDVDYLLLSEDVVNFYRDDIVFIPQFDGFPTCGRIQTPQIPVRQRWQTIALWANEEQQQEHHRKLGNTL